MARGATSITITTGTAIGAGIGIATAITAGDAAGTIFAGVN